MIAVVEKQHKSFTYAVIGKVKKDFIKRFELHANEMAFSLAEVKEITLCIWLSLTNLKVYHWYLHGHPTLKTTIGGNVSMSLAVGNSPVIDIKYQI